MREFEFKGRTYVVTNNGPYIKVRNKSPLYEDTRDLIDYDVVLYVTVQALSKEGAIETATANYLADVERAEIA